MKTNDDFKRVFDTDCSFSHPVDDSYTMNAFHFHNVFEIYFACTGGLTYLSKTGFTRSKRTTCSSSTTRTFTGSASRRRHATSD